MVLLHTEAGGMSAFQSAPLRGKIVGCSYRNELTLTFLVYLLAFALSGRGVIWGAFSQGVALCYGLFAPLGRISFASAFFAPIVGEYADATVRWSVVYLSLSTSRCLPLVGYLMLPILCCRLMLSILCCRSCVLWFYSRVGYAISPRSCASPDSFSYTP
ncbi:MAG: hypothetical protein LBQ66_13955 [Planctomycetaceae bacterium]|nr:hypothetical protein [Planctomycetaceae bacterium]